MLVGIIFAGKKFVMPVLVCRISRAQIRATLTFMSPPTPAISGTKGFVLLFLTKM